MNTRFAVTLLAVAFVLVVFTPLARSQAVAAPASGYEIYLGHNCGTGATCGASFIGWTGIAPGGGWLPLPGTGKGVWSLQINYTGKPAFGQSVNIFGGRWSFLPPGVLALSGNVTTGTVTWPADSGSAINPCKPGEAFAQATLTGEFSSLLGCLHDLPAGSVIPPTVWGFFLP